MNTKEAMISLARRDDDLVALILSLFPSSPSSPGTRTLRTAYVVRGCSWSEQKTMTGSAWCTSWQTHLHSAQGCLRIGASVNQRIDDVE